MRVLVLENNKFKEREIENGLKALQDIVGGLIEIPYINEVFSRNKIDLICNEEGKFIAGLNPEIILVDEHDKIKDVIMGTCIFASSDEEGNTISLTDEQIKIVRTVCGRDGMISFAGDDKDYLVKAIQIGE